MWCAYSYSHHITKQRSSGVAVLCGAVWCRMVLMGSFFNAMVVVWLFSPYVTGVMWWMCAVGVETVVL